MRRWLFTPGRTPYGVLFVEVTYDGGRLSFSGVEGPEANGYARGDCGQVVGSVIQLGEGDPEAIGGGWTRATLRQLAELWERWHLNDMRPGCEHQMAAGWDKRPIDPNKPARSYGLHFQGQTKDSWNLLGWVHINEHPEGLMCRPCPTCGYRYGTAWKVEAIPDEVLSALDAFPRSSVPLPGSWGRG